LARDFSTIAVLVHATSSEEESAHPNYYFLSFLVNVNALSVGVAAGTANKSEQECLK